MDNGHENTAVLKLLEEGQTPDDVLKNVQVYRRRVQMSMLFDTYTHTTTSWQRKEIGN
jgi:hypothetical protein